MNEKGVSIIVAIFIMLVLSLVIATVAALVATSGDVAVNYLESLKAFYIAEAGWAWARVMLGTGTGDWDFEESHPPESLNIGAGTFEVDYDSDLATITSTGYVPDSTDPRAKRQVVERDIPPPISPITAAASSEMTPHPAGHAIDGNPTTYWKSKKLPEQWLQLTFIETAAFDKVIFYSDTVNIGEFHIKYYDGASFVPVDILGQEKVDNMITVIFVGVESHQVQLVVEAGAKPEISEFEVYLGEERVGLEGKLEKGTFMETY